VHERLYVGKGEKAKKGEERGRSWLETELGNNKEREWKLYYLWGQKP